MPELPEVETIRQDLSREITGCYIDKVISYTPGVLINEHDISISGQQITDIQRRGKYLLIKLSGGKSDRKDIFWMVVHLRMTGRLYIQNTDSLHGKHIHVCFSLSCPERKKSGKTLVFQDTRRFGRIWLLISDREGQPTGATEGLQQLGPEPLDQNFDGHQLADQLKKRPRTSIKGALLDQRVLAGLGNIYADEALFAAGINPARPAESLNAQEIDKLADSIRRILSYAVSCQGTTLRDYVDGWNRKGKFQNRLQVYGRAGSPCLICSSEIKKMKLAGRTTSWCPVCQPEITTPE